MPPPPPLPRASGLKRPRIVGGFRSVNSAAELQELVGGAAAMHGVRHYGDASRAENADAQATLSCECTVMTLAQYVELVAVGAGAELGLYWAMYGEGDSSFQQRARSLLGMDGERDDATFASLGVAGWPADADVHLWLAPNGHTEQCHYDLYDNLHVTLRGTKVWRLFAPRHDLGAPSVFAPSTAHHANFSRACLARPDVRAFPGLRRALAEEVTLTVNAGEGVLVPAGWWHQVSAQGPERDWTLSANVFGPRPSWWRGGWRAARLRIADLVARRNPVPRTEGADVVYAKHYERLVKAGFRPPGHVMDCEGI